MDHKKYIKKIRASRHQCVVRVDDDMREAMRKESGKLNLSLSSYLIHCHNMWVRTEDGRVK